MGHRRSQRSADLHTQGPVSLRIGIRGKADASIWRIAAATAGQPKRGCADVQPLDSDDAICVIAGVRRDEDIAPPAIANAIVAENGRASGRERVCTYGSISGAAW